METIATKSQLEGAFMYSTNHQKKLLDFFKANPKDSFSAASLIESFKDINKATIYRKLASLEKESIIHKNYNPTTKRYEYRYAKECDNHLHLICSKCGNITHLECVRATSFIEHISLTHNFIITKGEAMLLGICKECVKNA